MSISMNRHPLRLAVTVTVVVVLAASACTSPAPLSNFGALCTSNESCASLTADDEAFDPERLHCRESPLDGEKRCLPPRDSDEPGETCGSPAIASSATNTTVVLDQSFFFGNATDDVDLECGGRVDVADIVVRFTVPDITEPDPAFPDDQTRRRSVPQPGVEITVGGTNLGISVRVAGTAETGCSAPLRFGCGDTNTPIVLQALPPGDYDLVIDGAPTFAGGFEVPVRVTVTRLDCPPDALPFDNTSCIRTSVLTPLITARRGHTMHLLADGTVVVVGGTDALGARRSDFELLDPTQQRWRYGSLVRPRSGHASTLLADNRLMVIAGLQQFVDDAELVDLRLVDARRRHAQTMAIENLESDVDTVAVAARAGERIVLVSTEHDEDPATGVLSSTRSSRSCLDARSCDDGEVCVESVEALGVVRKVCLCATDACRDNANLAFHPISGFRPVNDGEVPFGHSVDELLPRIVVVADRYAIVYGGVRFKRAGDVDIAEPGRLVVIDTRLDEPIAEPVEGALFRDGAALVALNETTVFIVGGLDSDGLAVGAVEVLDLPLNAIDKSAGFDLPRPVARPLASLLGGKLVVFDSDGADEALIVSTTDGTPVRSTLVAPRTGGVIVSDADKSVVIGGGAVGDVLTRSVERLALVGREGGASRAPLPCEGTTLAFTRADQNETFSIGGNTLIANDSFRSQRCPVLFAPFGRDNVFSFTLDTPHSVQLVNLEQDDELVGVGLDVFLLAGDCNAYEEISCGNADETVALFAASLAAGRYSVVLEYSSPGSSDDDEPYGGAIWSGLLRFGPPTECPLDDNDPVDDVLATAPFAVPDANDQIARTGRLCPGDVDNFIYEHWDEGAPLNVFLGNLPPERVAIQRAIVDTAASLAANRPIVSAVTGPLLSITAPLETGIYVITVTAKDGVNEDVEWELGIAVECSVDDDDSLVAGLDNANLARASYVAPGDTLERSFCSREDRDLMVFSPQAGTRPSSILIDAAPQDFIAEVFDVVAGALGPARAITIVPGVGDFAAIIELGAPVGPIALRLRVAANTPEPVDMSLHIDFEQLQVGDSCSSALPLASDAARSGRLGGDTTTFRDDHNAARLGDCTGYSSPGDDAVFATTLASGETISLTVSTGGEDDDVAVYILDGCTADTGACVAGVDIEGRGGSDTLTFTNAGLDTEFFIVIDSFYGGGFRWELDWSITAP